MIDAATNGKAIKNEFVLESVIASAHTSSPTPPSTCSWSWSWPLESHIHHASLNSERFGETSWPLECDSGNVFGMRSSLLLWAPLIVSGRYAPFERWEGAESSMDRLRMRSWQFFAGCSCQRVFGFLLFCFEFMPRIARLQKTPQFDDRLRLIASSPFFHLLCVYVAATEGLLLPIPITHGRYKINRIRLQLHTISIISIVDRPSKRQFASVCRSLLLQIVYVLNLHSTLIRSTIMLSSYLDSLIDWLTA